MDAFLRQHPIAVLLSTLLHVALAVALTVGIDPLGRRRAAIPVEQVAIQATVVDEALIQQELERLEQLEQEELRQQQEAERQAREQAEAARREREEEEQRLAAVRQDRAAEERLVLDREAEVARQRQVEAERERQDREEEERLAREREAEAERQRQAEAERQRQEAAVARQQAEMESELQQALAFEEDRRRAEEAGYLEEYMLFIQNRIQQSWIPPASAMAGLECVVNVTQIPSGDVVDVRVGRCNGDDAVIRSIEAAVLRASPLPRPTIASLFDRNLELIFIPEF